MEDVFLTARDIHEFDTDTLVGYVSDSGLDLNDFDSFLYSLTPAKRKFALSVIELYKRSRNVVANRSVISSSVDIYEMMNPILGSLPTEEFWTLYLNQGHKVVKKVRTSTGGIDGVAVDVRCVLKEAILANATQMVIVHNHPSDRVTPSNEDKKLTTALVKAAQVMNIRVIDHVIIGDTNYYSFRDNGLL